jgi:hypothetical protein
MAHGPRPSFPREQQIHLSIEFRTHAVVKMTTFEGPESALGAWQALGVGTFSAPWQSVCKINT